MRKSITLEGLTLSYLEKNETATHTLFYIHGNSGSANFWRPQFDDPLLDSFRHISFDLPAHGHSSADPGENYGVMDLGTTMTKAIKPLAGVDPYILVAISLGTNVVAEVLNGSLHPAGIVLAGPCILGDEHTLQNIGLPSLDPGVIFTDDAPADSVYNYYKEVLFTGCGQMAATLTEDHLKVKDLFRSTLIARAMQGEVSNELELLRKKGVPLLVVFGEEERVINPAYLDNACLPKWNDQVYKIPAAGHLVSLEQPQAFNELLRAYAAERFTGSPYSGRSE